MWLPFTRKVPCPFWTTICFSLCSKHLQEFSVKSVDRFCVVLVCKAFNTNPQVLSGFPMCTYHFTKTSWIPFYVFPKLLQQKTTHFSSILTQCLMLILSNQVWVLRQWLHLTQTLSTYLITQSWVFKSPFFTTLRIHRKLWF